MKHVHYYYPYEYMAHYEEEKLHCTFLATLICECGEIKPAPKPSELLEQ